MQENLNVKYKNIKIKQHSQVIILGCVLDENLRGEPMKLKALNKINGKLNFFYHKINFKHQHYAECYAMPLSSHILIMPALHDTLTSMKN